MLEVCVLGKSISSLGALCYFFQGCAQAPRIP